MFVKQFLSKIAPLCSVLHSLATSYLSGQNISHVVKNFCFSFRFHFVQWSIFSKFLFEYDVYSNLTLIRV